MFGERSYDPRFPTSSRGFQGLPTGSRTTIIAEGDQPTDQSYSLSGAAKLTGAIAGLGAAGFIPMSGVGRLWDKYLSGIRGVETSFPGSILRTFRTSEFLSPFASPTNVDVTSAQFQRAGKYSEFARTVFGASTEDIGYRSRGKFSIFGDISSVGKRVGIGIQVEAGTQSGAAIIDYYARVYGIDLSLHQSLSKDYLKSVYALEQPALPFDKWLEALRPAERYPKMVVGARLRESVSAFGHSFALSEATQVRFAKAETLINFARAKSASSVGRLNVLLSKPFDVPVVGNLLHKIPLVRSMTVKPGTSLQMAGRYVKKAAMLGAAYKGLEYYDYLRSEGDSRATLGGTLAGAAIGGKLFKEAGTKFGKWGALAGAAAGLYTGLAPRFDKGLFYGVASYFKDADIARAKLSEATGVREALERQEEITPGLLSLKTGLAMGGVGALGTGIYRYSTMLGEAVNQKFVAKSAGTQSISEIVDSIRQSRRVNTVWDTALGAKISKTGLGKVISKVKSPVALAFMAGMAAWGAMTSGLSIAAGNPLAAIPGIGLIGTSERAEELEAIYSGEKLVPIRKGRWWEFGRTPYEGGKIDYYRPHAMARLEKRAYQKGMWGTEKEKWDHDPLLHPLKAMFGDDEWKYYYEQKYQDSRPAPLTGTYFEDVPFFGPALAATVGKLFKPRKYIRKDEWMPEKGKFIDRPDRPELEPVEELGGIGPGAPVSPDDPKEVLNRTMYKRREGIGLVGFAEGAIQKAVTGREEIFENQRTMATMGKETGSEYWLWKHLNLGGGMGTTEPIRRFIPVTPSYLQTYNPLKNDLASWLPDNYFIDLKHGNPFDKISEAEIRLPGTGYAAFHEELEGVDPEDYPIAHRVKILGDVAMWSDEYKSALREAKKIKHLLSKKDQRLIRQTEEQVREKKKRKEFKNYKFSDNQLETMSATIRKVVSPGKFLTEEYGDAVIELQGIGKIIDREGAQKFAEKQFLGKEVTFQVPAMESRRFDMTKAGPRIKAAVMVGDRDFGSILAEKKFAEKKDFTNEFERLKFTDRERAVGSIAEKFFHNLESPVEYLTPISPTAKLIRQRSALEDYIATQAIGTQNAFWDRPMENFITPATAMAKYKMGSTAIPEYVQERRDVSRYFDMLEWAKANKLQKLAAASGDAGQFKKYGKEKKQTLFGLNPYGSPSNIMKALPSSERDYYKEFVDVKTTDEQKRILELLPQNEKRLYMSKWMDKAANAAEAKTAMRQATAEDEKLVLANKMLRRSEGMMYTDKQEARWQEETGGERPFADWLRDRKAEDYFSQHSLPGADWLGWHPSVDMDDIKMKYVDSVGMDYHDFGLWGQREKMLDRKPYINDELIEGMNAQANINEVTNAGLIAKQMASSYDRDNPRHSMQKLSVDGNNEYNITIEDKRKKLIEDAKKKIGA